MIERRTENGPLLAGDKLAGRVIRGFAFAPPPSGEMAGRDNDRLLFDGDEELVQVPEVRVPPDASGATLVTPMPPDGLSAERRRPADEIRAGLSEVFGALLTRPMTPWAPVADALFTAVQRAGHALWISGGATRDVLRGAGGEAVNDLDLSGTAPSGCFTELAWQALRAVGLSECEQTVNPRSLVCAIRRPGDPARMIEYRSLALRGYEFAATGSDLEEDAGHRDFAFNAVHYDVPSGAIVDPTGCGVTDLAEQVVLRPVHTLDKPLGQALVLLRGAKFTARWGSGIVDAGPLRLWAERLDWDLSVFNQKDWIELDQCYSEYVDVAGAVALMNAAAELGSTTEDLLAALAERSAGGR